MKISLAIISYRKLSFAKAFGFTVRDLMFLKAFDQSKAVAGIDWFERPDVGPEIIKPAVGALGLSEKLVRHRQIDPAILGPVTQGRGWAATAFKRHERALRSTIGRPSSGDRVLLDFNPFYMPPVEVVSSGFYWYDLIDNFALHNRFNARQISQVRAKYEFVEKHANCVTGVTAGSVKAFSKGMVVPNRLLRSDWPRTMPAEDVKEPKFDFGFLGFITDKIDLELLERLGRLGYRTLMCGLAYDTAILEKLRAIPNLEYRGKFAAQEAPGLTRQFKIGLVPYRLEKMHNESPIKFFQYIAMGRPSLMSLAFNSVESEFSEYVHYYDASDDNIRRFYDRVTKDYQVTQAVISARAHARNDLFWETSLEDIIDQVLIRPKQSSS